MRQKHSSEAKPVPFKIDRNVRTNLPEQVAEGFRQAILSGYYKAGDVLPARDEIARALSISVRVPREAVAILADESYVRPRRGVGCTVLPRKDTLWKGRVLIVLRIGCEGSYSNAILLSEVRRRLAAAGYQYTCVTVDLKSRGRSYDLAPVETALRQPTDLVLAIYPSPQIIRFLESRCDYLGYGGQTPPERLVGGFELETVREGFLALCRAKDVRRVLYLGYARSGPEIARFRKAGFDVEDFTTWPEDGPGFLEKIEREAMAFVLRRFEGSQPLPDLVYFADDYVARGGLTGLLARGVRVPDDVRVAIIANKGFTPVFPISLTRIENDPAAVGQRLAEAVCARLEARPIPPPPVTTRLLRGDSF